MKRGKGNGKGVEAMARFIEATLEKTVNSSRFGIANGSLGICAAHEKTKDINPQETHQARLPN
jgi:hypothetical protein